MKTKIEAVIAIAWEFKKPVGATGYKRMKRALSILGFEGKDKAEILTGIEFASYVYHDPEFQTTGAIPNKLQGAMNANTSKTAGS